MLETERIIGVSRYVTNPDKSSCEFSLVVADDFAGKGLQPDIVVEFNEDEAAKLQSQRNIEQRVQADVQLQTAINVLKLKS